MIVNAKLRRIPNCSECSYETLRALVQPDRDHLDLNKVNYKEITYCFRLVLLRNILMLLNQGLTIDLQQMNVPIIWFKPFRKTFVFSYPAFSWDLARDLGYMATL